MEEQKTRSIAYWGDMAAEVGCKWRVVEATFLLNYRGSTYKATVAADVPYHLTEALRRDDPRFAGINLQLWQFIQLISMAPPRKQFCRAKLLSIEEIVQPV